MKILIVIVACITVAAGRPPVKLWTYDELSQAIKANETDSEQKLYLEEAYYTIVGAMFTRDEKYAWAGIRAPNGGSMWTEAELKEAINDPATNPKYQEVFIAALLYLENNKDMKSTEVSVPAIDVSTWTMSELNEVLSDSNTDPDLLLHLQKAKIELEKDSGKRDHITIPTPVGLIQGGQTLLSSKL